MLNSVSPNEVRTMVRNESCRWGGRAVACWFHGQPAALLRPVRPDDAGALVPNLLAAHPALAASALADSRRGRGNSIARRWMAAT